MQFCGRCGKKTYPSKFSQAEPRICYSCEVVLRKAGNFIASRNPKDSKKNRCSNCRAWKGLEEFPKKGVICNRCIFLVKQQFEDRGLGAGDLQNLDYDQF